MASQHDSIDERREGPRLVRAWNEEDATQPPVSVTDAGKHSPGFVASPYGELYFMSVAGTPVEMAAQQGRMMREKAHLGVIPFYAKYLEKVFAESPIKRLAGVIDWAANRLVTEKLAANVPPTFMKMVEAFADEVDMPLDKVLRAYLMPEVFLYVLGTYHRVLGTAPARGLGSAPMFGCTSAVSVPPRSQKILHGRNFDYFGVDYWDRFPVVTFHEPDRGHDYISVSTAGIIGAGITGMNSAGLTLVVHQHFPKEFDLDDGVPVGVAGDFVMREASTIEEAVEILRRYPPVSGWTYVMTEGDTGRAAIYEVAAGGLENLRWAEPEHGALGYANVYWGKDLVEVEVDYYPEYRRCNYARQSRVRQCLVGLSDETEPADIARILADLEDPDSGEERLLGPTIVNVTTVASVVFEPTERRVWVGVGRSPVCRGWFVPFSLEKRAPDFDAEPFIPYPGWHESPSGKAFEYYRRAVHLAADGEADDRLIVLLEHALALHPEEPYLRVLAGLVSLRLGRGRRAEGAFRRALESIHREDRRAEILLYLGWAMDLQGRRTTARHLYKKVRRDPRADDVIRSRARYNSIFKFDLEVAERMNIDFVYGGVP